MGIAQTPEQILFALFEWIVVVWLVFRIASWLKRYIPNRYDLRRLYRLKDQWFQKARRRSGSFQGLPPPPTPFWGFCATIVAIAIELLNLFLLAQILDVFFASGAPIDIPYLGKYYVFCLIMAAIWMLAQIFIGHTCYEPSVSVSQDNPKKVIVLLTKLLPRWGWFVLLAIAVVGEGLLGFFRAWLLNLGEISEMGTIDTVIKNVGPIIAGLISLMIPVVGITAGVTGLISYIEPRAEHRALARRAQQIGWIGAFFHWFGAMVLRIFVCFHGQPPPLPFQVRIFPNVKKIGSQCEEWQRQARHLQARVEKIDPGRAPPPLVPDIAQLDRQVNDLSQRHQNYENTCQKRIEKLEKVINPAGNDKSYVLEIKASQEECVLYIKDAKSRYDEMRGTKKSLLKRLDDVLSGHQKVVTFWENFSDDRRRLLPGMSSQLKSLEQPRAQLEKEIEAEKKNWEVLEDIRKKIAGLPGILKPNDDPEIQKHLLEQELEEVNKNRSLLTEAQNKLQSVDLNAIEKILGREVDLEIQTKITGAPTATSVLIQAKALKADLDDLDLEGSRINVLAKFYGIKSKLDQEAKRLKKEWSLLRRLVRWLFGRKNMRYHNEPKAGSLSQ